MGKMNRLALVAAIVLAAVAIHASLGFPGLKRVAAQECFELIACTAVFPPPGDCDPCTEIGVIPHCGMRIEGMVGPQYKSPTHPKYIDITEVWNSQRVICYTVYLCAQSVTEMCPTDPQQWKCLGTGFYRSATHEYTWGEWLNTGSEDCP